MTDMLERVARAICIDMGEDPDAPTPYNKNADFVWQFYIRAARAAIEAMREPTWTMQEIGKRAVWKAQKEGQIEMKKILAETGGLPWYDCREGYAAWTAMIDAALAEGETE